MPCENLTKRTRRLALAALLGAIIFASKGFIPSPLNKMLIGVHALILASGALLLKGKGATFISLVAGILSASWNAALAPLTFLFSLLYGLLVDGSFLLFKVNVVRGEAKKGNAAAAMAVSTMIVGLTSYYATVHLAGLVPSSFLLEIMILAMGTISGAAAGYLASVIWNKYLKDLKF